MCVKVIASLAFHSLHAFPRVFQSCSFDCAMFSGLAFSVPPYFVRGIKKPVVFCICVDDGYWRNNN